MKKRLIGAVLAVITTFSFSSLVYAEEYDFANMTCDELEEVIVQIEDEIGKNHKTSSEERAALEKATKSYVELKYGADNVDWAWIDYTYTKDWQFYTLSTHADIKKNDGGKAQYDVYSELYKTGSSYKVIYLKIGKEIVLDQRSETITDDRILNMLNIANNGTTDAGTVSMTQQNDTPAQVVAEPQEDKIVARRGDSNETVRKIQMMLFQLNYLHSVPDGQYGENTQNAVVNFQAGNGLTITGVVTQSVYSAMEKAAAEAPEAVFNVTAIQLYNDFNSNAVAAKATYKGKKIQVSGTVDAVKESWGKPYVDLRADDWGFSSVDCYFSSKDSDSLMNVRVGQWITINGTCGDGDSLSVVVNDCSLAG